jgi:hypothetical protein
MRKRSRQYLLKIKANKPVLINSTKQLKIGTMYKFRYDGKDLVNMVFQEFISGNMLFVSFDSLRCLEIMPPVTHVNGPWKIHIYEQKERIKL